MKTLYNLRSTGVVRRRYVLGRWPMDHLAEPLERYNASCCKESHKIPRNPDDDP